MFSCKVQSGIAMGRKEERRCGLKKTGRKKKMMKKEFNKHAMKKTCQTNALLKPFEPTLKEDGE
jgi:hypothetical protein